MISASNLSLNGCFGPIDTPRPSLLSAVTFRLADSILQDVKKASESKNGLQFVAGTIPKLRIGGKSIDFTLSPEEFRNELYSATSPSELNLIGLISHRGAVKDVEVRHDVAGSDAALAALENSLAIHEQEKQANSTHLTKSVLPAYRNRFDAARKQKQDRRLINSLHPSASLAGTPRPDAAPTSTPTSDASMKQFMRTPLIHLLALGPASNEDISAKTHIPKTDLEGLLLKIGTKESDGRWKLSDRAYRDLDVWEFKYSSQDDRQAAIDNAIRAYDRQRIGKEEKIWQLLLPKAERNKGKTLSRLHLGVSKGLTPNHTSSPADLDPGSKPASAANTPRIGALPRPNSSRGNDVMKRLLSKDGGKKARALEADKERKRKEKEDRQATAASDREGKSTKRAGTNKKPAGGFKSAEIVHSSDEASAEEGKGKESLTRVDSKTGVTSIKGTATSKGNTNSTGGNKTKTLAERSAAKQKAALAAKAAAASAPKPARTTGKVTPHITTSNGLSAPNSQQKPPYSPQKPGSSRPPIPSPLGAARPRVASDVSDRAAIGVQRTTHGANTPTGLGISNSGRKRQSTITSSASNRSSESDKKNGIDVAKTRKPAPNGTAVQSPALPSATRKPEHSNKRKEPPSDMTPPIKHRKTESDSSQSQTSRLSQLPNSTAGTSPDFVFERSGGSSSSDSAASVLDTISYAQGIHLAEKFREYYPRYEQMYEALQIKQDRGSMVGEDEKEKLWSMHRRLEEMKRQIERAAQREHED